MCGSGSRNEYHDLATGLVLLRKPVRLHNFVYLEDAPYLSFQGARFPSSAGC
jgi:hypothetical protein